MDAKELDGLTRELFEKWPECGPSKIAPHNGEWRLVFVPDDNAREDGSRYCPAIGVPVWAWKNKSWPVDTDDNAVDGHPAAALIRVAIEDALQHERGAMHIARGELVMVNWVGLPNDRVTTTVFDGVTYASFHGPTLLHALIAAALAVAGRREGK